MIEGGRTESINSDWAYAVVYLANKDETIRLSVDFRHLSSSTIADAYPMKIVKDLFYEIRQEILLQYCDLKKSS